MAATAIWAALALLLATAAQTSAQANDDTIVSVVNGVYRAGDWSDCSQPCGGGYRTRSVLCYAQDRQPVDPSFCTGPKPVQDEACNTLPCDAEEYTVLSCDPSGGEQELAERCNGFDRGRGVVTVRIAAAANLPDLDRFGNVAGFTDAFARVTLAGITRDSEVASNSLDPEWPRKSDTLLRGTPLTFGMHGSGEAIRVELWDADSGLEFGDDYIGSASVAVIGCSQFAPRECAEQAWVPLQGGAVGDDPDRTCYIGGSTRRRSEIAPCVLVDVRVEPFRVQILKDHAEATAAELAAEAGVNATEFDSGTATVGVDIANEFDASTDINGQVAGGIIYADGGADQRVSANRLQFRDLVASTIIWTRNADRNRPDWATDPLISYSISHRARVYVFWNEIDVDAEFNDLVRFVPWLEEEGWEAEPQNAVQLHTQQSAGASGGASGTRYYAWSKLFPAGGEITMRGPRVGIGNNRDLNAMYAILAQPVTTPPDTPRSSARDFDRAAFVALLVEFLLPNLLLIYIVWCFLARVKYRVDNIQPWLASRILPEPPNKEAQKVNKQMGMYTSADRARMHLTAALFLDHGITPRNMSFRRHLFWATLGARILVAAPLVVNTAWGIAALATVNPPQVGLAILLVGAAVLLILFASAQWAAGNWRLTRSAGQVFGVALILLLLFLALSVLADPDPLSTFSLSAVAVTFNLLPMIGIAFASDPGLRKSFKQITAKVTKNEKLTRANRRLRAIAMLGGGKAGVASLLAKLQEAGGGGGGGGKSPKKKDKAVAPGTPGLEALRAFDERESGIRVFPFSGVEAETWDEVERQIEETIKSKPWLPQRAAALKGDKKGADVDGNAFESLLGGAYSVNANDPSTDFEFADPVAGILNAWAGPNGEQVRQRSIQVMYLVSLLCLVGLSVIAWAHIPEYPNSGFAVSMGVLTVDVIFFLAVKSREVRWSPGYMCLLMALSRAALVFFSGEYWLAGHSVSFLIFGFALAVQVIARFLPVLTAADATAMAFLDVPDAAARDAKKQAAKRRKKALKAARKNARKAGGRGAGILSLLGKKKGGADGKEAEEEAAAAAARKRRKKLRLRRAKAHNVGESPAFLLGVLGGLFLLLLVGTIFATPVDELAYVPIAGASVPVWAFGVGAFVLVLLFTLAAASTRAFYLESRGLLPSKGFLFLKALSMSYMLAGLTEVVLVMAGCLFYAILESPLLLILCVLGPICCGLAMRVVGQWEQNDLRLLQPPSMRPQLSKEYTLALKVRAARAEAAEKNLPLAEVMAARGLASEETQQVEDDRPKTSAMMDLSRAAAGANADGDGLRRRRTGAAAAAAAAAGSDDDDGGLEGAAMSRKGRRGRRGRRRGGQKAKLTYKQRYDMWMAKSLEPAQMSDCNACMRGFLSKTDYFTLASGLFFVASVFVAGGVVQAVVDTTWFGHALYIVPLVLLPTYMTMRKWFAIKKFTVDMWIYAAFALVLHTAGMIGFYAGTLKGDPTGAGAIWIWWAWAALPVASLGVAAFLVWYDNAWEMPKFALVALPIVAFFAFLFVLSAFFWGSAVVGGFLLIAWLLACIGAYLIHVWASFEYYLPQAYLSWLQFVLMTAAVIAIAVGILFDVNLFVAVSTGCVLLVVRSATRVMGSLLRRRSSDEPILFSPFIFPIFSLNAQTGDVRSENELGIDVGVMAITGLLWGMFAVMFANIVDIGIGICAVTLVICAVILAFVAGDTTLRMGEASRFMNAEVVLEAAKDARRAFFKRRNPLDVRCTEFVARDQRAKAEEAAAEKRIRAATGFGATAAKTKKLKGADLIERMEHEEQQKEEAVAKHRLTAAQLASNLRRSRWSLQHCYPWEADSERPGAGGVEPMPRGGAKGHRMRLGRPQPLHVVSHFDQRALLLDDDLPSGVGESKGSDEAETAASAAGLASLFAGAAEDVEAEAAEEEDGGLELATDLTFFELRRRRYHLYRFLRQSAVLYRPHYNAFDPAFDPAVAYTLQELRYKRGTRRGQALQDRIDAMGGADDDDDDGLGGALIGDGDFGDEEQAGVPSYADRAAGGNGRDGDDDQGLVPLPTDCCSRVCGCCGAGGGLLGRCGRGLKRPRRKAEVSPYLPVRRQDSLFTFCGALHDAFVNGASPLSFACARGLFHSLLYAFCGSRGELRCCGVSCGSLCASERERLTRKFAKAHHADDEEGEREREEALLARQEEEEAAVLKAMDLEEGEEMGDGKDVFGRDGDDILQHTTAGHSRRGLLDGGDGESAASGGKAKGGGSGDGFGDGAGDAEAAIPDVSRVLNGRFERVVQSVSAERRGGYHCSLDIAGTLQAAWDGGHALDREYYEEARMIAHFQLLILVSAQARVKAEAVSFQRFLREYLDRLEAKGIPQPSGGLFKTESYATVDVQLVATWLDALTPEQRKRFRKLRTRFAEKQAKRFRRQLQNDAVERANADQHKSQLAVRERYMARRRAVEFAERRAARRRAGIEAEDGTPEEDLNAKEIVEEVERSRRNCQPGTGDRDYQFRDPDFPPDERSLAQEGEELACRDEIVVWKPSKSFNNDAELFRGGTDPDDIYQGLLTDGWLLAALSVIAASGGVGDNEVDALIDNLFFTNETTTTGLYVVRLYMNGQWETVVVDDYFPAVEDVDWDDEVDEDDEEASGRPSGESDSGSDAGGDRAAAAAGAGGAEEGKEGEGGGKTSMPTDIVALRERARGAAFAHSGQFNELWVPVLEKAFAKYYGSYAKLQKGFVHHALEALTGAASEEVFLAEASRGPKRMQLWDNMTHWIANGFLMGAGSIAEDASDKVLLDSGLVFGSVYTIYEVVAVDGLKLIKLRNPPGDHGEWTGDWSDDSPLWTRRLKTKLGFVNDADDGTFWMSFDDFCVAFRSLYLCRWFDLDRWNTETVNGFFKGPTAAGLPSIHNPNCQVQNNPQFALVLNRPTDVSITLSQSLPGLSLATNPHPVAIYIVSSAGGVSQEDIHAEQQRRKLEREQQRAGLRAAGGLRDEHAHLQRTDSNELARHARDAEQEGDDVMAALMEEQAKRGGKPLSPRSLRRKMRKREKKREQQQAAQRRAQAQREAEAERRAYALAEREQLIATLGRETGAAGGFASGRTIATRVYQLTSSNVVASSGRPLREQEVRLEAELPPGAYTVLVATYQRGMEGPFSLTMRTNFKVHFAGLFPPSRSVIREHITGGPGTLIAGYAASLWERATKRCRRDDWAGAEAQRADELEAQQALAAMEAATLEAERDAHAATDIQQSEWIELYDDVQERRYWYNIETKESHFEPPEALLSKQDAAKRKAAAVVAQRHEAQAEAEAVAERKRMNEGMRKGHSSFFGRGSYGGVAGDELGPPDDDTPGGSAASTPGGGLAAAAAAAAAEPETPGGAAAAAGEVGAEAPSAAAVPAAAAAAAASAGEPDAQTPGGAAAAAAAEAPGAASAAAGGAGGGDGGESAAAAAAAAEPDGAAAAAAPPTTTSAVTPQD